MRAVKQHGATAEALYGGYLAIMHGFDGLDGISHGILYTESKSRSQLPGSGGPPDRYYIPTFHDFRSVAQTTSLLALYPDLLCECHICSEYLRGDPHNIQELVDRKNPRPGREFMRRHYLQVRFNESKVVEDSTVEDEVERLRAAYSTYHRDANVNPQPLPYDQSTLRGFDVGYLARWADAFS